MGNDTSENGTGPPYNATGASGNLMYLIVSHNEVSGTEDGHEPFRPPGGSSGEAGCLGNRVVAAVGSASAGLGQQVPDAPTPQGPDSLGNITLGVTPGKGTQPPQEQKTGPTPPPPATGSQPAGQDQDQQTPPTQASRDSLHGSITLSSRQRSWTRNFNRWRGLTYRDFEIYENNVRQHIDLFTADPYPLSVALVIDQSLQKRHDEEGER